MFKLWTYFSPFWEGGELCRKFPPAISISSQRSALKVNAFSDKLGKKGDCGVRWTCMEPEKGDAFMSGSKNIVKYKWILNCESGLNSWINSNFI